MTYNPNMFSVTNMMMNGQNGPSMTNTTMFTPNQTQPTLAPPSSQIQPNTQQLNTMPSYAGNLMPPMTTGIPQQTIGGPPSGIISVNPNATVVQGPNGNTQFLQPSVGYTGMANYATPTISPNQAALANQINMTAPGPPPHCSANPQGNQVPNWYNIENTPQLQAQNAYVQNLPHATQQCSHESNQAAMAMLQAQHRVGQAGPLGMHAVTSNEFLYPRKILNMNRPPSNQVFPPLGIPGNGSKQPVIKTALKSRKQHEYCPEMYMTPYDRTQNKIATGVLTNPYTGEVFQTFEEGMPLPQKNDSLLPSQLKQTNPKLVQLQGGIDFNAPPPSKKEIAENIPLINGGPNVWGDALYQPQLRQWHDQRAVMQQWNNRNGILPNYGINKERAAGFVGDVNMLRPVPYNPATMRNAYDLKGYTTGVTDANYAGSMDTWNVVQPVVNNLDPNRGQQNTFAENVGIVQGHGDQMGVNVVYDPEAAIQDLRATMKTLQEQPVPITNVQPEQLEGYIYNPPDLKATMKVEADTYPFVRIGMNPQVQDNSVYQMAQNTDLNATNKTLFQVPVPIHNISPDLPHTQTDLTQSSEQTETKRQYYGHKGLQAVANVSGEQYTTGLERGPQAYAEWTKVSKRGGSNVQTFRVVPNRTTDSLSNQGNFSPGCSQRDIYPEQLNVNDNYGSFVRPTYADNNAYQQTDFAASLQRPLPATTHCFKRGNGVEADVSQYTMQPMPLSMVGGM